MLRILATAIPNAIKASRNTPLRVCHKEMGLTEVKYSCCKGFSNQMVTSFKEQKRKKLKPQLMAIPDADSNKSGVNMISLRQQDLNEKLKSYVTACIDAGMPSEGYYGILHHIKYRRWNGYRINDPEIYNNLIKAYARKADLKMVKQVFSKMKSEGAAANSRSYIYSLLAVTNESPPVDLTVAARILEQMKEDKLCVRDELINGQHMLPQADVSKIFKMLEMINPSYCIDLPKRIQEPYLPYFCDLLRDFEKQGQVSPLPYQDVINHEVLLKKCQKQLEIERQGYMEVKSIAVGHNKDGERLTDEMISAREEMDAIKNQWRSTLKNAFNKRVKEFPMLKGMKFLYPFYKLMPADRYVDCMMRMVERILESPDFFTLEQHILQLILGKDVNYHYILYDKENKGQLKDLTLVYEKYLHYYNQSSSPQDKQKSQADIMQRYNFRQYFQKLCDDTDSLHSVSRTDPKLWTYAILCELGRDMVSMILTNLYVTVDNLNTPAFYTIFRNHGQGRSQEEVKKHPKVSLLWRGCHYDKLTFEADMLPMLSPPVPWCSHTFGACVHNMSPLVRHVPGAEGQSSIRALLNNTRPHATLYPTLDAINQLASIPWIINKSVLTLAVHVFQRGGNDDLAISPPGSSLPLPEAGDVGERRELRRERLRVHKQRREMHALWCNVLYKLSIAERYRDDIIWLPQNIDFRGRAYPIPPYLNHIGDDLSRGLLLFAKGEPLGPGGLDWLKIHCINLTELKKKASVEERLQFANDILHTHILASASQPFGKNEGNRWWQNSENPWQTLACCMEIAAALKCADPAQYICHLPVHQDGSCNGLQHYAALGRDSEGATSVNLAADMDRPQDVYSDIVLLVERERQIDAENGVEIAQALEGFIQRKVIKQTVMTTVYGVTMFGARRQILRQLSDLPAPGLGTDELQWAAAAYLAGKTLSCLQQRFTQTKLIQDWLVECAGVICRLSNSPVQWVTPLGLPVLQPYFKTLKKHSKDHAIIKADTVKHKNAFPPNFIHSLDAVHMMLTALHCQRAGITFASVHDCFWTHANSVHLMNKICRQQFVSLHEQPILSDLSQHLVNTYTKHTETPVPTTDGSRPQLTKAQKRTLRDVLRSKPDQGDFDLHEVLRSVYFFS